jgi:hypothetical protein
MNCWQDTHFFVIAYGVLKSQFLMFQYLTPHGPLHEIDRYAEQYHMTRSGLLAQAADQFIHRKQLA